MRFPATPTCHGVEQKLGFPTIWRPPLRGEHQELITPYRTCSFCGSIHPEDLLQSLKEPTQVEVHGTDWKYGWPHKFYVVIPNPEKDNRVPIGYVVKAYQDEGEIIWGTRERLHMKWYNDHLEDEGFDDESFEQLTKMLQKHSGILFKRVVREGKRALRYTAPYDGYQR